MEDIGKRGVPALAKELAKGWRDWLDVGQRSMLANEVEILVGAVLIRELRKLEAGIGRDSKRCSGK